MAMNIIVVHGMRKGTLNEDLNRFIDTLLQGESYHYEVTFLESDTNNPYIKLDRFIKEGHKDFNIIPFMIFSGAHLLDDMPAIVNHFQEKYQDVTFEVCDPLGLHPLMVDIVTDKAQSYLSEGDYESVILYVHGSTKYRKPEEQLKAFAEQLSLPVPIHVLTLYGSISYKDYLEDVVKGQQNVLFLPIFFYDGYLVNTTKKRISKMELECNIDFTTSINFDSRLKDIINDRIYGSS
ncbi:sirohydrochlorin chelatase [Staphylococcus sp. SQ8-PEA]|uniref:Sirohydrochlorin chelatase n=1 Tax=Staphylococcus marylandisciuri TaxID=2981529 RepID=A0ABT2QMU4_9STAP|nr:CbiX/SirB N-terminal domain-containing protein [Staphylococcus marylandisciuri]MCU5745286.1 sirohydrochlorin chelatase [Staphylococcus marylandisciuri]